MSILNVILASSMYQRSGRAEKRVVRNSMTLKKPRLLPATLLGVLTALVVVLPIFINQLSSTVYVALQMSLLLCVGLGALFTLILNRSIYVGYVCVLALLCILAFLKYDHQYANAYGLSKLTDLMIILPVFGLLIPLLLQKKRYLLSFSICLMLLSFFIATVHVVTAPFYGGRANIFLANPIWLARILGYGQLISSILIISNFRSRFSYRFGFIIVSLVCVLAIFLTGSRGPLIASVLVTLIVLGFGLFGRRRNAVLFVGVLLMLSFTMLFFTAPEDISARFSLESLSNQKTYNDLGRFDLYELAYILILEQPQGYGLGGFAEYHWLHPYPHNIVLEVAVEAGVWVAAAFIAFLVVLIAWSFQLMVTNEPSSILVAAFFLYELANALFSGDVTSPRLFYTMMVLIPNFIIRIRREPSLGLTRKHVSVSV
jgi:O-antigen ligase